MWPDPLYPNELNATGDALGLKYFPEKALFNEYRQFTVGNGHDLADFDTYQSAKCRGLIWPVVNGKETLYRFNLEYDPYAKADNLFYGMLMKPVATGDLYGVTNPEAKAYKGTAKIFSVHMQHPSNNLTVSTISGFVPAAFLSTGIPAL